MNRYWNQGLVIALPLLGMLVPEVAEAASLTPVDRATWGASGVPNYVNMHIYVPDNLATKPPVVVASHSCSTPIDGFWGAISGIKAAADKNGFIIVLPEAKDRNCWDVGTTQSLTHDGGGDTHAIAQMVKYVLQKYDADPSRVYAMGGSSGAMMTQALMAVYPDIFRAGSARAGVPAGCWSDGYDPSNQWGGNCAAGNTSKTAEQWGDLARGMYPGYTGHRPRVQLFHAKGDPTIRFPNHEESIKQWTNVLGLSSTPDSTEQVTTSQGTYTRRIWKNECGAVVFDAWAAEGGNHSTPGYEFEPILAFFGLDQAGAPDPEPECPPGGGGGGAGGMGGAGGGGSGGADTGGADTGGAPTAGGGGTAGDIGAGGTAGQATSAGTGGSATGGAPTSAGQGGSGGTGPVGPAGGAPPAVGGTLSSNGGSPTVPAAGSPAAVAGGASAPPPESESGGCSLAVGGPKSRGGLATIAALGLAFLGMRRRRRSASC